MYHLFLPFSYSRSLTPATALRPPFRLLLIPIPRQAKGREVGKIEGSLHKKCETMHNR